jgi:cyclohexadienyl dehydratase
MKKIVFGWLAALISLGVTQAAVAQPVADSASSSPPASRLDAIVGSGALRVCTTGDYRPFTFERSNGRFEGIDIDMAESLAASLHVKAEYVKTTWSNLMGDFLTKCDIAMGGVSTTLERQKRAFFSQPYMVDGKAPIARCADADKYRTLARIDQASTRVIVNKGGTNEQFAKRYLSHASVTVYPDNVTIFEQILSGKADVMVTDASETLYQQKLHPGLCAVQLDRPFQYGEKAYLLPRGDVVFQEYVDQWLHLARASGDFAAIFDKWLR